MSLAYVPFAPDSGRFTPADYAPDTPGQRAEIDHIHQKMRLGASALELAATLDLSAASAQELASRAVGLTVECAEVEQNVLAELLQTLSHSLYLTDEPQITRDSVSEVVEEGRVAVTPELPSKGAQILPFKRPIINQTEEIAEEGVPAGTPEKPNRQSRKSIAPKSDRPSTAKLGLRVNVSHFESVPAGGPTRVGGGGVGIDSVGQYLHEIGRYPLLTAEQEVLHAQMIRKGREAQERLDNPPEDYDTATRVADKRLVRRGRYAYDSFVLSNLRLVASVAKRYQSVSKDLEYLDLIQEGNLGMHHAVEKFDERKGFKFSTYATFWIRQAILRALDQKGSLIRLPGDRRIDVRNLQEAEKLSLSDDDICETYGWSQAYLNDVRDYTTLMSPTSMSKKVGNDDSDELGDLLADDHKLSDYGGVDIGIVSDELWGVIMSVVSPSEVELLKMRAGYENDKMSYREIGETRGVTAEAARRQMKKIMDKLRTPAVKALLYEAIRQ